MLLWLLANKLIESDTLNILSSHVSIMVGYPCLPQKSHQNKFTNWVWKSILFLGYTNYAYQIFTLFLVKQVIAIVGTYISSEHHLLPWIYESRPSTAAMLSAQSDPLLIDANVGV